MKTCTHTCDHAQSHPPTFFQRLANFDITVCSLELVEEGAHFEFICDALSKLWHDSAVLPRSAHLKHIPVDPLEALWCGPVHHLVALDVLRLLLHLVRGTGDKDCVSLASVCALQFAVEKDAVMDRSITGQLRIHATASPGAGRNGVLTHHITRLFIHPHLLRSF